MSFDFDYENEQFELEPPGASMELNPVNSNEQTTFDLLPVLDLEELANDLHQCESTQKRPYPFNDSNSVTNPSIAIFAQPLPTQHSCTKRESKSTTVGFICGEHRELNGQIYDCPAIGISQNYLNPNRSYFIRVTLTTVELDGNRYIHPCLLETPETEYQKGISRLGQSIFYPINSNTVDPNGIMKFDKLIIVKATQKDLKNLVPFESSNEDQATAKRSKKATENFQLKHLQLAFSVHEVLNQQIFQPIEKVFSNVMQETEEGELRNVQSTHISNGASAFYDEFQSDTIDTNKWEFLEGTGENGWGTHQKQYYTGIVDGNARCENGRLIIEARKEPYKGCQFTSARLRSRETFLYGRLEIRAKLPPANGTWASFLLLPVQHSYGHAMWPENGELNVMSHLGRTPGIVRSSICTKESNPWRDHGFLIKEAVVADGMDNFKTYSLEWTPDRIEMSVRLNDADQNETSILVLERQNRDWKFWPFDKQFHLEIYLAVGGDVAENNIDENRFPQRFEIEYVYFRRYNNA